MAAVFFPCRLEFPAVRASFNSHSTSWRRCHRLLAWHRRSFSCLANLPQSPLKLPSVNMCVSSASVVWAIFSPELKSSLSGLYPKQARSDSPAWGLHGAASATVNFLLRGGMASFFFLLFTCSCFFFLLFPGSLPLLFFFLCPVASSL